MEFDEDVASSQGAPISCRPFAFAPVCVGCQLRHVVDRIAEIDTVLCGSSKVLLQPGFSKRPWKFCKGCLV